jgi:TRL-like protein family
MHRALLLGLALASNGCAGLAFRDRGVPQGLDVPAFGPAGAATNLIPSVIYIRAGVPLEATGNTIGTKSGEACAYSILGWVTVGDASIRAAADAGGVRSLGSVDTKYRNILGVWAQLCTVVTEGEPSEVSGQPAEVSPESSAPPQPPPGP